MEDYKKKTVWQDRLIIFDASKEELKLREGEESFDVIHNIEDSKSGNGDIGTFLFTNLRLIWFCNENSGLNMSIGYNTIIKVDEKDYTSKISGETKAISLFCKSDFTRYELLYNPASESCPNLYLSIQNMIKIYESTRLYRDVKVKGEIAKNKKLALLLDETILKEFPNINFISPSDRKSYKGNLIVTKIRLVWISSFEDNFNLSIPWIQIKNVTEHNDKKIGSIINIHVGQFFYDETYSFYPLNKEEYSYIFDFITKQLAYAQKNPKLGINIENFSELMEQLKDKMGLINPNKNDLNKDIDDYNKMLLAKKETDELMEQNIMNDAPSAISYAISNKRQKQNDITNIDFSKELGIATEKLPEGETISKLWKILN